MSTFQKTNMESREDSLSCDFTTSATPATQLINSTGATLTEGRSALTMLDTSDQALTNGVEADETDLEAAHEVVDEEADQTPAIVDEDEAILEAALDLALEADQPAETVEADLVQLLVTDDQLIGARDRALLAKIALDPDLPDALDLAPVPDKLLLSPFWKNQSKSRVSILHQISVTQKIIKKVDALTASH